MIFDWSCYKGNLSWLQDRTIFMTVYGSRAYGTSLPDSDYDFRGVAIPPRNYYLGLTNEFKTAEQKDPDLVIFELRKFLKLASDCNPNALEILFTEPEDQLVANAIGAKLLANRDLFLTKKAKHTFFGYAHSQMGRILTHRAYILNPMKAPPTREEFNLPDRPEIPKEQLSAVFSLIQKRIDELSWHELDDLESSARQAIQTEFQSKLLEVTGWDYRELGDHTWVSAANSLGFESNFLEYLDKERRYKAKCKEWDQYQEWKKNRNPIRAALEEKYHYDLKHGLHLVRLARSCKELLATGKLQVRRPDAEELLAIRQGAWSFDQLYEWFQKEEQKIAEVAKTSSLPHHPDAKQIDALCLELIEESFRM